MPDPDSDQMAPLTGGDQPKKDSSDLSFDSPISETSPPTSGMEETGSFEAAKGVGPPSAEAPPEMAPPSVEETLSEAQEPTQSGEVPPAEEPTSPTAGAIPSSEERPILKAEETVPPEIPPSTESQVFHAEKRPSVLKKVLPFLILLLAIVGIGWAVFRFVLPRVTKPKEITLVYWGLWEPDGVVRNILDEWERDHPKIKINYSQQSHREYRERLQSALARNEGPDVFRFHNTWLPMFKNELEPVPATVMDATTFERTFYPVAASSLRSGANYLGIPLEIDTLALFYNQDIFTAAGVGPPRTWDELRELASQLTLRDENGQIQRAGVALGTTGNIRHWSDILGLMMLQNSADLANPTGSLAEDALTFYTVFSKTDRVWDESLPSSLLAFATGKTAMFFGFSWDVFEIKNIDPDLNFKIVSVPQLPGADIAWASFWVEGVAQKSQNKEAAWEFLKFLSSKEVMQKLYQAESKVRLFGEPYSRVEMGSLLQADSMVAPFINQASKAETWYLCSRTFDNGINDRIIKYFEDVVNAVNGGETSKKALTTAASGVAQILSQYGLGSYTVR